MLRLNRLSTWPEGQELAGHAFMSDPTTDLAARRHAVHGLVQALLVKGATGDLKALLTKAESAVRNRSFSLSNCIGC